MAKRPRMTESAAKFSELEPSFLIYEPQSLTSTSVGHQDVHQPESYFGKNMQLYESTASKFGAKSSK